MGEDDSNDEGTSVLPDIINDRADVQIFYPYAKVTIPSATQWHNSCHNGSTQSDLTSASMAIPVAIYYITIINNLSGTQLPWWSFQLPHLA